MLAFAVIAAGLSLGCRWIAFHPKTFVLKFFPYYDQYYQPSRFTLAFSQFFGLAGHIVFTLGAISSFMSAFLPLRFAGSFFVTVPSIAIAVCIWKKSLRGALQSQQEDKSA